MYHLPFRIRRRFVRSILPVLAVALLCLLSHAAPGQTATPERSSVLRATLANGLQVVLVPNRLAPVVTTVVTYKVGADETPAGFPGMAHAEEHMMFRGSPGLSGDALAYLSASMGGNFDAQTRQNVTQYYFTVPAENLDVALHIEAIRMGDVLNSAKDWQQERKAIEQEVAQDISSPGYLLYQHLRSAMFAGTSYAHDALGTRPSFEKTTSAMLKAFHASWYAPNNAVLVVTGDLDPGATLTKVKTLFGGLKARKLPPRPSVALEPLTAQAFSLDSDLPYGLAVLAFRMPGNDSPDRYSAQILADVLNSQRGRLYDLVPKGTALDTGFSIETLPHAGLGYATLAYPAGGNAADLHKALRSVIGEIARTGVSADLVEAAKRQERANLEFQKTSISQLASVWSEAVAVDGETSPAAELAGLEKVTVADVNRVARQYLDPDRAITATLTPRGAGKPVAGKGFGGREAISLGNSKPAALPAWATRALRRLAVPKSTVHPTVSTLANGIRLIVQPESISDTVSVYGHILNRPELQVPAGKDGLSQVLDGLLGYGSQTLDRVAFQKALDDIGASASAGTDFSLQVLADKFERGTALLADNELHPRLPAPAFKVVKQQVTQKVVGRRQSPDYLSMRALRNALFPEGDPERREARRETVATVTLDDVRAYYKAAFRPDLATIVVIGNVTPARARAVIEKYFGAWKASGKKPDTELQPVALSAPSTTAVPDASRVQTQVTLAETLGLNRSNPDYYALQLGNYVLGGAFYSTRLYRDLRKDTGLVYFVGTGLQLGRTRGIYSVQYACDPQNVPKAHQIIVRDIRDMQTTPVTAGELRQAKAQLLREIPLSEADVDGIARGLLQRVRLGLPLDEPTVSARHYLKLKADDVRAAFAKWIRLDGFALVTLGPAPG